MTRAGVLSICSLFVIYGLSACSSSSPKNDDSVTTQLSVSPEQAERIAEEAYVYGYPLVLMDITKKVSTNVVLPEGTRAPINHFGHMQTFPDANFRDVVSPNADTLYSSAWLDLTQEPIVLTVPNMGNRYYMIPMLDAWTNVIESPGTRTTGNRKGSFVIVGPNYKGEVPGGLQRINAPTNMVWLIGRTKSSGAADFRTVNALQDQYIVMPLSQWKGSVAAIPRPTIDSTVDMKTAPVRQLAQMDPLEFYRRLAELMRDNPPNKEDTVILSKFRRVGYIPGEFFDTTAMPDPMQDSLRNGAKSGWDRIRDEVDKLPGRQVNGWKIVTGLGDYKINYGKRAAVALVGLGANLDADAIYPRTTVDADGELLTGLRNYVLHFRKDQLPPVQGFWSVTMYNKDQFFVKNPINRFSIGDRNKMSYNRDGSLDIYIQASSPGKEREANWLPAPREEFNLVMRLYWPKPAALDGTWQIPGVQKSIKANNLAVKETP